MTKDNNDIKVHGVELFEAVRYLSSKNKRYIAITLQEIENIVGEGSPEMAQIRKHVLDGFNNLTRAVAKLLFEDVED